MKVLVIAENDNRQFNHSIQKAVTAAKFWESPIDVLIAGNDSSEIAQEIASIEGVERVIYADETRYAHPLAEDMTNLILSVSGEYGVILAAHSSYSRNILPRVAAKLDVAMISDVLEIKADHVYIRSKYAGNVQAKIQNTDSTQVLTIHGSNFSAAGMGAHGEIINIESPARFTGSRWLSESRSQSDRPVLSTAKVVVSGGRSLGSAELFEQLLSPLAMKLGAALGATRAAVDAGLAPNALQVGQTGIVVAPELYIAVGVSGAIQHTYGMKDSRVVVAINQDPDAAIFQVADYGLVADLFEVIPALTAAIQ